MDIETLNVEWTDVKTRFIELIDNPQWRSQPALHSVTAAAQNPDNGDWSGGSANDTLRYLREGFRSDAFNVDPKPIQRARKRATWSEEDGEPDAGRLYGGADEFYLTRGVKLAKPGLVINADCIFSGMVNVTIIQAYGAWLASLIGTLETEGYDLEVAITQPTGGVWEGSYRGGSAEVVRLVVKRPNEVSDFSSWSALFGPTGYRHLLFAATGVAGDKYGKVANYGLGPIRGCHAWSITNEDGRVTIGCNSRGAYSPDEVRSTLNRQAKEVGLLQ